MSLTSITCEGGVQKTHMGQMRAEARAALKIEQFDKRVKNN